MSQHVRIARRRRMLQFLAASPLLAHSALAQQPRSSDPADWAPRDMDRLIDSPREALDVFDFEPVMKKNVPPAHFGYMATGVDDEVTLRANREGFLKFELRPRRLVDVSRIDTSADIFGFKYDSPIVIAPTGSNRAFHPDAEVAVAKAAKGGTIQILYRRDDRSSADQGAAHRYGFSSIRRNADTLALANGRVRRRPGTRDADAPEHLAKRTTFALALRRHARMRAVTAPISARSRISGMSWRRERYGRHQSTGFDRACDTVKGKPVPKGILASEDANSPPMRASTRSSSRTRRTHGRRRQRRRRSRSSKPPAGGCRC